MPEVTNRGMWWINQTLLLNGNNAFLNEELEEDVDMCQPYRFEDKPYPYLMCKLNKAFYELKQFAKAEFQSYPSNKLRRKFQLTSSPPSLLHRKKNTISTIAFLIFNLRFNC